MKTEDYTDSFNTFAVKELKLKKNNSKRNKCQTRKLHEERLRSHDQCSVEFTFQKNNVC